MLWISLVLGIIQAIPELISVIKAILDAIHGKPLSQRLEAEHRLQGHLLAWQKGGDKEALKEALSGMLGAL